MPSRIETQVNTYTTGHQLNQQITTLTDGGWVITWDSVGQDGDDYGIYAQAYNADGTVQGGETQINTYTTSHQGFSEITALSDGGWVITWESDGQDGDLTGIYAQAYNADGSKQGVETHVSTYTTLVQYSPQITALSDGGWVITWQSFGQDGSGNGVYAQAYNADGTVQGGETHVSTYTTSAQQDPQITALADGGWVITWQSNGQDGDSYGINAQAYNADGTPQGGEAQVNTHTINFQGYAQITALTDGGWVIVWRSYGQDDGNSEGIYAQAYNADGTKQGGETQVNTYETYDQSNHQIAALTDGGWVITWTSLGQDGDSSGIYAQAYNADGTLQGGETQVNTYTTSSQSDPQITALADGGWVMTWRSYIQDGDNNGVYMQAYNADGTAQGSETQVNTYTTDSQQDPQITALPDGGWVITWTSGGQDGDIYGIYSRTFAPLSGDAISVAITGTQEVGEVLTAALTGVNADDNTLDIDYVWMADGAVFYISQTNTLLLTAEHAGKVISLTVQIEDSLFTDPPIEIAAPTGLIDDGNNDPTGGIGIASDNAVSDRYEVGDTISTELTSIQDADVLGAFDYQWMRGGVEISGANSDSYLITAADEGHKISLVISYTDGAGFEETLSSIKARVQGFTGEDTLGTTANDVLVGSSDNDRLNGWKGDDTLFGSDGRDVLIGGKGNDVLSGGGDKDKLVGGQGDDLLLGGAQRDKFIFNDNSGNDTIGDFEDGLDQIRITAGAAGIGDLTIAQVGDDVLISYASTTITVLDTLVSDFGADDFAF